jgi:hypothetical protein
MGELTPIRAPASCAFAYALLLFLCVFDLAAQARQGKGVIWDDSVLEEDEKRLLAEKGVSAPDFAIKNASSPEEFETVLMEGFYSGYEGYDREYFYLLSQPRKAVYRIPRHQLGTRALAAMLDRKRTLDKQLLETPLAAPAVIREFLIWRRTANPIPGVPPFDIAGSASRPEFAVIDIGSGSAFRDVLLRTEVTYDGFDDRWLYAFSHEAAKEYRVPRDLVTRLQIREWLYEKRRKDEAAAKGSGVARYPRIAEHAAWLEKARPNPGVPVR